MSSSEAGRGSRAAHGAAAAAIALAAAAWAAPASAQQQAQGFALERLYLSAPGAGWIVMDSLDLHGGPGAASTLTVGYAHDPLRVRSADGTQRLTVVSDQAFADLGFAATYDRWRIYLNIDAPLSVQGQSGTVGAFHFAGPAIDLASNPDTVTDLRLGADGRIVGAAHEPFRLGLSAQLLVPNGNRCNVGANGAVDGCDYTTDDTYRGMLRILAAGDFGLLTYAAQLGVHIRPFSESAVPGSPKGSELLFGVAAGVRAPVPTWQQAQVVVGPEVFGATAFDSLFGSSGTALEGLLSARLEGTREDRPQLRVRAGVGAGLDPRFGAPEWRAVISVEAFGHLGSPGTD